MKMNFSFFKNAVSAFLLLLFVCMGSFATAQSLTVNTASDSNLEVLKPYSENFVNSDKAIENLYAELALLDSTTPAGGVAEATHSIKRTFVLNAGQALKMGGDVLGALVAGNSAAVAANGNFASGINVNNNDILVYYAELLSN